MLAKVGQAVVEEPDQNVAIEDINAHRSQAEVFLPFDPQFGIGRLIDLKRFDHGRIFRLLDKAGDALFRIDLHNTQRWGLGQRHRNGGHGHIGVSLRVLSDNAAKIHAIELIAAQDEHEIEIVIQEVSEILAHRIGGPLIPRVIGECLFRSQNFHEPSRKMIELVGLGDMPVERGRVELGEEVNALQIGIDAVGNRDVDQTILPGQRHRRLGSLLGQREETGPLPSSHDDGQDVAGIGRQSSGL